MEQWVVCDSRSCRKWRAVSQRGARSSMAMRRFFCGDKQDKADPEVSERSAPSQHRIEV